MRIPLGGGVPLVARIPLVALAALAFATGCEDIRRFDGAWTGSVAADPAHQQGFTPTARLRATVEGVTRRSLDLTLELPDGGGVAAFEPIKHAADDVLGEMRLNGEPLRTFIGYSRPATGTPYLTFVSLFAEDRIEVRLIRGPDEAYGVFALDRVPPGP